MRRWLLQYGARSVDMVNKQNDTIKVDKLWCLRGRSENNADQLLSDDQYSIIIYF